MPSAPYGQYSAAAGMEPYNIESTIAQGMVRDDPSVGLPLLNMYRSDRGIAEQQYAQELAGQHQYAYQQLAATMAHNAASDLASYLKEPGGLALIAHSPQYQYLLGGADPDTINAITGMQTTAQQASNIEKAGRGAFGFTQAGVAIPGEAYQGVTGLPAASGTPLALQVAALREANANARANQAASGYSISLSPGSATPVQVNLGPKYHGTMEDVNADLARRGFPVARPAAPLVGDAQRSQQPPARTNVPPAKGGAATGGGGGGGSGLKLLPNTTEGLASAQQEFHQGVVSGQIKLTPDQRARYDRGVAMNGGRPPIAVDANGKRYVIGGDGKPLF